MNEKAWAAIAVVAIAVAAAAVAYCILDDDGDDGTVSVGLKDGFEVGDYVVKVTTATSSAEGSVAEVTSVVSYVVTAVGEDGMLSVIEGWESGERSVATYGTQAFLETTIVADEEYIHRYYTVLSTEEVTLSTDQGDVLCTLYNLDDGYYTWAVYCDRSSGIFIKADSWYEYEGVTYTSTVMFYSSLIVYS
ncbi:MAG: hypothetical protein Q4Q58_06500 [Thermoplasmata archaeon]|nr:hypothetical protein [Thermoplasmata archaeon]